MNMNLEDLPEKLRKQAEAKIAAQNKKMQPNEHRVGKLDKIDLTKAQNPETSSENQICGRKNKYGNKRCEANGITFDSKKERINI